MALTQSLVENYSLSIDSSTFASTGDKVFINGHYYSDKPPLPSILAAGVYWPLYQFGLKLDFGWNFSYYLIILFTVKLFWIFSVLAFNNVLRHIPLKQKHQALATLVFAFASLTFSWSATFNNHSLAASSLMIAFMFYLNSKVEKSGFSLLWSGLFFGVATAMDIPSGIFLVGFGVLVFKQKFLTRRLLYYVVGAMLPLGLHFSINYAMGGTLLPLQIISEFFVFEGSTWSDSNSLSGVHPNSFLFILKYGLLSLLGCKGFLWYNPLLILLFPIMLRSIRSGQLFQQETLVILTGSIVIMAYYFVFSSNYGGWSYSIRWFVPILPLFYFYLFDIESFIKNKGLKSIFMILVAVSIVIALVGLINPWSNAELHSIPFLANLKQLMTFFS